MQRENPRFVMFFVTMVFVINKFLAADEDVVDVRDQFPPGWTHQCYHCSVEKNGTDCLSDDPTVLAKFKETCKGDHSTSTTNVAFCSMLMPTGRSPNESAQGCHVRSMLPITPTEELPAPSGTPGLYATQKSSTWLQPAIIQYCRLFPAHFARSCKSQNEGIMSEPEDPDVTNPKPYKFGWKATVGVIVPGYFAVEVPCDKTKNPTCNSIVTHGGLTHLCQTDLCNRLKDLNIPAYLHNNFNETKNETICFYTGTQPCGPASATTSQPAKAGTTTSVITATSTAAITKATTSAVITQTILTTTTSTAICNYIQCWTYLASFTQSVLHWYSRTTGFARVR